MTIKIEEKRTKNSKKRTKNNKYKADKTKRFRNSISNTILCPELKSRENTYECFEKFRIRIKEPKQSPNQFLRFKVRIPENHLSKKQSIFFRIKIKQFVEHGRDDSKQHLSEYTNDSDIVSLQEGSHSRNKKSIQIYNNQFRQFLRFRTTLMSPNISLHKKNVSFCSLVEIIEIFFHKKLIIKAVYNRFIINYNERVEIAIIQSLKDENQAINLKGCLFFIIDHRILTKILSTNFPDQYEPVTFATNFNKDVNQYLKQLYELEEEQYFIRFNQFNKKHNRFWMPESSQIFESNKLSLNFEENIEQIDKMKSNGRILRRRT